MNELELILTELAGTTRVPARALPTAAAARALRRRERDRLPTEAAWTRRAGPRGSHGG